jgi:hypothetical protein
MSIIVMVYVTPSPDNVLLVSFRTCVLDWEHGTAVDRLLGSGRVYVCVREVCWNVAIPPVPTRTWHCETY